VAVKPERIVFNETRTNVSLRFYYPLLKSLVGHLGLGYSGMETSEIFPPESELIFIGGPGTLRGYRNEQFLAQRTATGTMEPRLRFDQGYLFFFYDAAYINRPIPDTDGNARTDEFYRDGYGFGVALLNSEKSLKMSLGWNRDLTFDQPRISIQFAADI
jgi:hemolysin activation/secretion protein